MTYLTDRQIDEMTPETYEDEQDFYGDGRHYIDYLFEDKESGELFIVEVDATDDINPDATAWQVAAEYFDKPHLLRAMTPAEGEAMGLDTY